MLWLPETDEHAIKPISLKYLEQFECDSDLNDYFHKSAIDNEDELLSKNYVFVRKDDDFIDYWDDLDFIELTR